MSVPTRTVNELFEELKKLKEDGFGHYSVYVDGVKESENERDYMGIPHKPMLGRIDKTKLVQTVDFEKLTDIYPCDENERLCILL